MAPQLGSMHYIHVLNVRDDYQEEDVYIDASSTFLQFHSHDSKFQVTPNFKIIQAC